MRLIDADALLQEIESLTVRITGLRSGKSALAEFMREYKKSVLRIIEEQPTAYNLDAVVEQLECNRDEFDRRGIVPLVNMDYAVDIVRNGGKE